MPTGRMMPRPVRSAQYNIVKSGSGTWRRFVHPDGRLFAEYTSAATIFGMPLVHYTSGISPDTNKNVTARGFIAIGRRAVGVVAIGRFAAGLVAVGQIAGGTLAVGQASAGLIAVGQAAVGAVFGLGQVASGAVCIAQLGIGEYVLAQLGIGEHVWSQQRADPEAVAFFREVASRVRAVFGI